MCVCLQKLLQDFSVIGEDEITLSLPTKDGLIPIIMKINEAIDESEEKFPIELNLMDDLLTECNANDNLLTSAFEEVKLHIVYALGKAKFLNVSIITEYKARSIYASA